MPTLHEMLEQDITREIEGVVKADDIGRIEQEIREYVITAEIEKMLLTLFEGYAEALQRRVQKSGDIYPYNGVWISGYFGSGKSHLLKILSYLMSDKADPQLREVFLAKIENEWLRSAVEQAFRTPATSVLFNIDQQADAEAEDQNNIILFVFEKMFNRTVGYCDDDPVVADFERELDSRGEYEAFKEAFASVNGAPWQERRDAVMTIDRELFAAAWAQFKGVRSEEAMDLLDRYEGSRSLSAEKFAKRVAQWLDRQEDDRHRINFFIDEVGQFVSNRRDRMLNLQTIAETLATICENRAWVFVTSQEDLDSVIGDASQEQRNDFSRITARFHFRLALTSANVEEVIQKRLLAKNEEGRRLLQGFYEKEADHLRTVYHFDKGVKEMHFAEAEHFISSYPFAAYQYYYLQQSLRGLSDHNAFTGRHVSRGERSMLEVFQEVGKQMADSPLFRFATFDQMFDGIRNTLQGGLISQINLAEQQLGRSPAVRIIKTLLMLKYVKDFTATLDHLTTLMTETVDQDREALKIEVQTALDQLEYQSYIQRNGEEYEYLTDREKDVEIEIKNTQVEYSDIRQTIAQILVDKILKSNKLIYEENGQSYPVAVNVDDESYRSGKSELSIKIVTHLNPNYEDLQVLLNQGMGKKELLVILDIDQRVANDLRLFHQTRLYLNHITRTGDQQQERILQDKQLQNAARERMLREEVIPSLVKQAALYVSDRKLDISTKDSRQRLLEAFQELVSFSFPNLRLLKGSYSEETIREILFPSDGQKMFSGDAVGMGEDESDMQAFLQRRQKEAQHTTIATLKETYSRGQYGWYEWAVLGVLAKLYAREAVELVEGSRILDTQEVFTRLTKGRGHELVTVRLAQPIDSGIINTLAAFYQDFFHRPITESGGKELVNAIKQGLIDERQKIHDLLQKADRYPFLRSLEEVAKHYDRLTAMEYRALADTISDQEEELLQEKLEVLDKAVDFMDSAGSKTYEKIKMYLESSRDNFTVLGFHDELQELEAYLENPKPWASNATKQAQDTYKDATEKIVETIEQEKQAARTAVEKAAESVKAIDGFSSLDAQQKVEVLGPLKPTLEKQVAQTSSLSALQNVTAVQVPKALGTCRKKLHELAHPEKEVVYAAPEEKAFAFSKAELASEADVDQYTKAMSEHYKSIIKKGKRIGL